MHIRLLLLAGLAPLAITVPAAAQAEAASSVAEPASASHRDEGTIEEVLVVAQPDRRTYELAQTLDVTPDSAALLKRAVGANVFSNGPITGMAQYRGMSRMRISSRINGQHITPGGPNWMDPPLSYAPAAHLESLEVFRGIAPVSAGMETIGGVVNANTWQGRFAESGSLLEGRMRIGAHSVNEAALLSGAVVAATENHRLKLSGLTEQADDAKFPDGRVLPTEYRRDRFDLGYGYRIGAHRLQFDYGRSETGDAGTPALPMDIEYIDADLFGFGYGFDGERWQLDGRLWHSNIDHGMTNYHLRPAPGTPGMFRRNVTEVVSSGFSLLLTAGAWRLGVDGHDEVHNSDISNPNAAAFFVTNFNDASRRLLGLFVERDFELGEAWELELGGRYNHITSDADEVNATPAMLGMPPAVMLRDAFNDADRSVTDQNVDLVARLNFNAQSGSTYYLGLARKTRAPAYQERYLWLPLQATAGLADGQTYTGNPDLDSEVAREVELGWDLESRRVRLSPRVFYRDVKDYIQGSTSTNTAAIGFVRMMNMRNGTSNPDPLEFQNLDAELYGMDVDGEVVLADRWRLSGVLNYVRGRRDGDNLYRIPPLNGLLALSYAAPRWGLTAEALSADGQTRVSETNREPTSSGYATFNLRGYWQLAQSLRLSAGVDNLADRRYRDHLGGINRVQQNPDIAVGERLPGYGRNLFARLDLTL
jgi:iron complex outermembrane receptor protein